MGTGQSAVDGPSSSGHSMFPVASGHYASAPVFGPSGDMYLVEGLATVGDEQPELLAFSPSGQQLWAWSPEQSPQVNPPYLEVPAVGPDGTVYESLVPSEGATVNGIVALDPATGKEKWQILDTLDLRDPALRPTVGPDGTIYLQTQTHLIAVSSTDGSLIWSWPVPAGPCPTWQPVLSPDGATVYASGRDGSVSAITNGTVGWTRPPAFSGDCPDRPAVAVTGQLVLTDNGTTSLSADVAAITSNGIPLWSTGYSFPFAGGPALTSSGLVVAESQRGDVLAFDGATGQQLWSYRPDDLVPPSAFGGDTPLVVGADGTIYASDNYQVAAITPNGTVRWSVTLPSLNTNPASMSSSGLLYLGAGNLEVFGAQ